jgi:hypothetical protein
VGHAPSCYDLRPGTLRPQLSASTENRRRYEGPAACRVMIRRLVAQVIHGVMAPDRPAFAGGCWLTGGSKLRLASGRDARRARRFIHVISPRHPVAGGQASPHPQASRPARPPHRSTPILRLPGVRQPHHQGAVAAQLLHPAAHTVLLDAHPSRLALAPVLTAACAAMLMTQVTRDPACRRRGGTSPGTPHERTRWSAGSRGRCPQLFMDSPQRTPAHMDVWRTGTAARMTANGVIAGQGVYGYSRASGL